ncbi:MAG: right-handed parallel beta-helix repeat-containing protein [Eubacteriales bacterium]|nr:right-handed parallel beta-helix repeat-containing protein [Eubacteriales bacterium]
MKVHNIKNKTALTGVAIAIAVVIVIAVIAAVAMKAVDQKMPKNVVAAIYVSPDGNDEKGNGSLRKPYLSLSRAMDEVGKLSLELSPLSSEASGASTDDASAADEIIIFLRGGVHSLTHRLILKPEDLGGFKITFKNYKDECPVLSSNIAVTGFSPYRDGIYKASLQQGENGEYPKFRDLYIDGKRAVLARTGSRDEYMFFPKTYDRKGMYVNPGILENIPLEDLRPLELCLNVEWMSRRFRLASYSAQPDGTVQVISDPYEWLLFDPLAEGYPAPPKRPLLNNPYWFENHLSLLDEPGEWFYDSTTGTVYYYPMPDEDINTIQVEYPMLESLVKIEGTPASRVSGITFEGIGFTGVTNNYASDHGHVECLFNAYIQPVKPENYAYSEGRHEAAFYALYADDIVVSRCRFFELGSSAIFFREGCNNLVIDGNAITDVAMSGIEVGDLFLSAPPHKYCTNIRISNNYIENIGTDYRGSLGIFVTRINTLEISNNHLKHLPYTGIAAGYGYSRTANPVPVYKNIIRNNYVEDVMYALNDGGPIYVTGLSFLRDVISKNNRIYGNYVLSNASSFSGCRGIYFDGCTGDWVMESNVIDGFFKYPVFCQYHVAAQQASYIMGTGNYSTVTPIKDDYPEAEKWMLIFKDNEFYKTRSELPEEAWKIIENAGLPAGCEDIVPAKETVIIAETETPHQELFIKENIISFRISDNSATSTKNKTYMLHPYYTCDVRDERGKHRIQLAGLPDGMKLELVTPASGAESITIDDETGFPLITVKAGQKDAELKIALKPEEGALSKFEGPYVGPYMMDFKLIADTGESFSFPRLISISTTKQYSFIDTPQAEFHAEGNLIRNAGMDSGDAWTFSAPFISNQSEYGKASYVPEGDNSVLKVDISRFPEKRSQFFISQNDMPLLPNKKYRVSFYIKISGRYPVQKVTFRDTGALLLRFYTNDGKADLIQNKKYVDFSVPELTLENNEWMRIEGTMTTDNFILEEGSVYRLRLYFGGGVRAVDEPLAIYLDNISLVEAE